MTPEIEAVVADARTDTATFVSRVLEDPVKLEALATLRRDDPAAIEMLWLELKNLKVPHVTNLKAAVGRVKLNCHAPEVLPTPTATDVMTAIRAEIDASAVSFESTAELLDDVVAWLVRYVSFPDYRQADAVALWILHTWAIDCFDVTPRLSVQAPQRESGKTRLLEAVGVLILRPRFWILPSPAVVYRTLDLGPTSLLLDEVDAIFRGRNAERHDELRAIINEGYTRNGTVPRMVFDSDGKNMKPVEFPVFAPVALAGIGGLHDTLESRSLVIRLQRQKRSGRAAKFRRREVEPRAKALRDRIVLWAGVHADDLRRARPTPPKGLSDRAEDIWEPLVAIAELAGECWRKRADDAARYLAARAQDRADDVGVVLLRDLKTIFEGFDEPRMFTAQILERLKAIDESPWRTWGSSRRRDPGLTAQDLAKVLDEFEIHPKPLRIGDVAGNRGYELADFFDAWDRYCPVRDETLLTPGAQQGVNKSDQEQGLDGHLLLSEGPEYNQENERDS
jgi:Protein of unknown function (DUF3631)